MDSGTEIVAEEVTEGQVLDRESARPRAPVVSEPPASRIGQMLADRYRLEKLVAKGGMGRVYLATQLPLEREVAIKLLVSKAYDEEFRQRFFLEASTCARLVHRHIVTVHDYGEADNGELFMAMEYLDGAPLSKVISREIRLEPERACQVALQICRALRCAHKSGIVHRDLKPGNVMLLSDDDQESADFAKVLDFGLVKAFEDDEGQPAVDLTRSGTWLGSPRYMAPEQIRCKGVDPRTDIYSLGVILFHMVAGRPPFVGSNSVEILEQHLRDPVPGIRELVGEVHYPPELEVIIRTCMAKDPADRYQSMDEVIVDLKAAYRIATGVSIHTESSLPIGRLEGGAEGAADFDSHPSASGSGARPRGDTALSRPPPVPELGPPPDLSSPPSSSSNVAPLEVPPPLPSSVPAPAAAVPVSLDSASGRGEWAEPSATPLPAAPPRRRLWPLLLLALLFVAGVSFVVTRSLSDKGAPETVRPKPVQLTVHSTPSGAEVIDEKGEVLGRTPLTVAVPPEARGETVVLTLRREAHKTSRLQARLDQDRVMLQAALQPLPSTPAPAAPAPEVVESPPTRKPTEPAKTSARRTAPRRPATTPRRPATTPRRPRAREPEPEPEAQPKVSQPDTSRAAVAPVDVPRPRTVDERGSSLVVDEGVTTTVDDRAVPVVD